MHYCIIGAGSVGGYFGARLQEAGESVTYLVRPARKENLAKKGLVVESYLGNSNLRVSAVTDAESLQNCDVTIISIRNYHLDDQVLENIKTISGTGSKIISFLNGVEHIERLRSFVPDGQIIGGSAFIDSRIRPDGAIIHRGQDPTIILGTIGGEVTGEMRSMKEALHKAGVKCTITGDLLKSLWKKYLFVMMGTMTGVAGATIGQAVSNASLNQTLVKFAGEMQAVALEEGVNLDDDSVTEMLSEIRGMRSDWKSLMTEDMESGRPTEFNSLWGYIIRKADVHRLDVPVLRLCYGILGVKNSVNSGYPR